jgi:hypothetical protein
MISSNYPILSISISIVRSSPTVRLAVVFARVITPFDTDIIFAFLVEETKTELIKS